MTEACCTVYTCALSSELSHPISSLDIFKQLLLNKQIGTLIDIRQESTLSNDRQFSDDQIRSLTKSLHIDYHWAGRHFANNFSATEEGPDLALQAALRGFADFMRGDRFAMAYKQLVNLCNKSRSLIFSEVPDLQQCTRRLISDYLLIHGHRVIHMLDSQHQLEHPLSPELRRESIELVYDRKI